MNLRQTIKWLIGATLLAIAATPVVAARQAVSFESERALLSGTLVLPDQGTPVAGVVLIHGSGPDGAEDYVGQAQLFADRGVAALVYDKRGWNRRGGDWRHRPFALLGKDANAAARFLRSQSGVPPARVGYWGISQGGWVLPLAASHDPRTAFVIGVAATSVSPVE